MGLRPPPNYEQYMTSQQGGFNNLPFMPGVISSLERPAPYYGFIPPAPMPSISTYRPDLKTRIVDAFLDAFKGKFPGSEAIGLLGQIVYHGSPHVFDKFSMSKVGTGEGAQAYGHGLYFADKPQTAMNYSRPEFVYKRAQGHFTNKQEFIADHLSQGRPELNILDKYVERYGGTADDAMKDLISVKQAYKGYLYEVDLPDEAIGKMLDWDAPLSQQPEHVTSALRRLAKIPEFKHGLLADALQPFEMNSTTGQTIFGLLDRYYEGDRAQISGILNRLGIPGIKYLDQGSRTAGKGTHNYVVFDEKILTLKERMTK